jgi:hypothetical protein
MYVIRYTQIKNENINHMKEKTDKEIQETPIEPAFMASPAKKISKGKLFFILLFLVILAGLIYSQYQLYILKDPAYQQKVAEEQVQLLLKKVSKIMLLPTETPQIVQIQDVEKLKAQQPFFKDAQNGDEVLIYTNMAIVYSPSMNKIINVGPVSRESAQATTPSQQDTTPAVKTQIKAPQKTTSKTQTASDTATTQ